MHFAPEALCPLADLRVIPCYVFGLKIGKSVELGNNRICVLRWLQISSCSVIWKMSWGVGKMNLQQWAGEAGSFLLFNSVGNPRVLQMILASIREEETKIQHWDPSRMFTVTQGFCIVNLIPTRCHQSCLKDGNHASVIYKLLHPNWWGLVTDRLENFINVKWGQNLPLSLSKKH